MAEWIVSLLIFAWLTAAAVGYGRVAFDVARRWLPRDASAGRESLGDAGLAGLVVITVLGLLIQLVVPLSPAAALWLTSGGVACLLTPLRATRKTVWAPVDFAFVGLSAVALVGQALLDGPNPDGGLYYVQTLLWNSTSAIVPGLANVHGRFGFNGAGLILAAALRVPPDLWKGAFMTNVLLAILVMSACFAEIRRGARRLAEAPAQGRSTVYATLALAGFAITGTAFRGSLGNLSSDFGPFILAGYVGLLLIRSRDQNDRPLLAWAMILSVFAVTLKPSALPLGIGVAALFVLSRGALTAHRRLTIVAGAAATTILALWIARGFILSGCAVYPVAWTCSAVFPWTVPAALAANEARYAFDYARGSIQDPASMADWIGPVAHELWTDHFGRVLLFGTLAGACLLLVGILRARTGPKPLSITPQLGISLAWIGFAIWKGPALRFYAGGAWLCALTVMTVGLFQWRSSFGGWLGGPWIPRLLCLALALQAARTAAVLVTASPQAWPAIGPADVVPRTTDSGLQVLVSKTESCWDATLPCTPYFDARLRAVPWLDRFYFVGANTIAYHNGFPARPVQ